MEGSESRRVNGKLTNEECVIMGMVMDVGWIECSDQVGAFFEDAGGEGFEGGAK